MIRDVSIAHYYGDSKNTIILATMVLSSFFLTIKKLFRKVYELSDRSKFGWKYHVTKHFPFILWNREKNKTFWDSKLSEICQLGIQLIFFQDIIFLLFTYLVKIISIFGSKQNQSITNSYVY